MPSTTETWKHVFQWLCQARASVSSPDGELVDEKLTRAFPPVSGQEEIKRALEGADGTLGEPGNYVYLQRPERSKELQPILGVRWSRADGHYTLRLYLLLCRAPDDRDGIEGLGFRLEVPEDSHGSHSFFHTQLVKVPGDGSGSPSWLPDKEPTMPLAARDEVQLVASLAVCLYGMSIVQEMQGEQKLDIVRETLSGFAASLRPPEQPKPTRKPSQPRKAGKGR